LHDFEASNQHNYERIDMAEKYSTPTQSVLRSLYWYDPVAGEMISRRTNKATGWIEDGYRHIELKGKSYRIHRLIWMYLHDRWPTEMIDHINGNKLDNSIVNLREVTAKQNAENRNCVQAISGMKGVIPTTKGRWKASIGHNGKVIYLGTYDSKQEAHNIYCKAAQIFHTHNPSGKT
jgi:hypothetical protein